MKIPRRLFFVVLLGFGLVAVVGFAAPTPGTILPAGTDPLAALEEGNRLFESGDLETAAAVYRSGYDAERPHPTLTYNLATTLHHLDRLPEAVLWYLRGPTDDPWTEENLWLARKSLGSQRLALSGGFGWIVEHGPRLADALIVWVWLASLGAVLLPASRSRAAWIAALLGTVAYAAVALALSRAPEPVVLLVDCQTAAGDLPAGTEAWARSTASEEWSLAGLKGAKCPAEAVEAVGLP